MVTALREQINRVKLIESKITEIVKDYDKKDLIDAFMAFRGIGLITAVSIVSEVGNFSRFKSAPAFMSYVGVVPREHSSGSTIRKGSITKTGNTTLRDVLTEVSHHSRHMPNKSPRLEKCQGNLPSKVIDIAWDAQVRLNHKYRSVAIRKGTQKAVTAVCRELAGFIWAAAKEVESTR